MDPTEPTRLATAAAGLLLALIVAPGCNSRPRDTHMLSPYPKTRVVAIAPFMNHSGSPHVDPLIVSDLFFTELQMVRGFQVLPVNRSLQAMAALNMQSLASPQDALRLAEFVGADMIFVGAVTAYDPYDPPEVGLAVQLYSLPARQATANVPADSRPPPDAAPVAQVNEVYNAGHQIVQKQVREYADIRGGPQAPLDWRLYTRSIQHYLRFCCHRAIRDILMQEQDRRWMIAGASGSAERQP